MRTAGVRQTRDELTRLRPGLVAGFDRELPGARAAVLARVLGALGREPLPGLRSRAPGEVTFDGNLTVNFPSNASIPFTYGSPGLAAALGPTHRHAPGSGPARRHAADAKSKPRPSAPGPYRPDSSRISDLSGEGERTTTDPAELVRALWGDSPFAAEIENSVANLAMARAAKRPAETARPGDPDGLGLAEQALTDGHPLHPCCRTRGGMTVEDVLTYAPEHSPVIRLRRLRVPADRWYGGGEPVLLAHPWQADRLRGRYPWLTDDGETGPARPLMSLRTVAPLGGGPHVKTAVDVQMTSAVRTVSPAAVHNGPRLSRLLKTLTRDLPIEVLAELDAGAVIVDGEAQRHLAYLTRGAPVLKPGEIVVPAAGLPGVRERGDPERLVGDLAARFFAPAVTLLARGVALEAHGQNTLFVLENGRVTRVLYRDLGGVRVSPKRLRAHGLEPPELHGDLPSDDPGVLRTKLAASALATVAAELITTLPADPARLWAIIAAAIRETGTADVPHLLGGPLPVKATTAMRLAADPLDDIWASLDNPLAEHA